MKKIAKTQLKRFTSESKPIDHARYETRPMTVPELRTELV